MYVDLCMNEIVVPAGLMSVRVHVTLTRLLHDRESHLVSTMPFEQLRAFSFPLPLYVLLYLHPVLQHLPVLLHRLAAHRFFNDSQYLLLNQNILSIMRGNSSLNFAPLLTPVSSSVAWFSF